MSTLHHWEVLDSGEIMVSSSPEGLWKQAVAYFKWCDENPIQRKVLLRSGSAAGTTCVEELPRAYNLKALCLHCGIEEEWINDIEASGNRGNLYYTTVSKILYAIHCQQYELASVGELNPIFTSRALKLETDATPNTAVKVEVVTGLPQLSSSESDIMKTVEQEFGTLSSSKSNSELIL